MANKPSAMDLLYLGNAPKPKPVYTTPIVDSLSRPAPRKPAVKPKPTIRDVLASTASTLSPTNVANALYETGKDVIEATPEALARAYGYVTTTPLRQMAGDVGNAAQAFGRYFVENPVEAAMDFIPGVGEAKQLGQDIRAAAQRRAIGDLSGAQRLEGLALPLAAATLVPGLGEGRAAARAADDASGVLRLNELTRQYEMDLPDLAPPATTPDFSGYQFTRSSTAAPQAPQQLPLDFNKPAPKAPKVVDPGIYVKPAGNLNLTPRITSAALRGPDQQTVESFIANLRGKSDLSNEALDRLAVKFTDPQQVMTKAQFAESLEPSKYNLVDLRGASNADDEHLWDMAIEEAQRRPEVAFATMADWLNASPDDAALLQRAYFNDGIESLPDYLMQELQKRGITDEDDFYDFAKEAFDDSVSDIFDELGSSPDYVPPGLYSYGAHQRLVANPRDFEDTYFEMGVTHPEQTGTYRHFAKFDAKKQNTDGGLVGHIRGTFFPDEPGQLLAADRSSGEVFSTKPNSMVIEELQSDAGKEAYKAGEEAQGHLLRVHPKLFQAAVQHGLQNGATTIYYPTAKTIASVRGAEPSKYASIYDGEVSKYGLKPLLKIPGVTSKKVANDSYVEINFSNEAVDRILRGEGQKLQEYKSGGLAVKRPSRLKVKR